MKLNWSDCDQICLACTNDESNNKLKKIKKVKL